MAMFDRNLSGKSAAHARLGRSYDIAYTAVDFVAGLLFVVGSVFFFYDSLFFAGDWLFLIGSICFAIRPTVKILREFHLTRLPLPNETAPPRSS